MEIFFSFFHDKSAWELVAVFLGLAYLLLAMKESLWCWPAAFISTAIYTWLFWHVSLLMDSALNIYYMVMAGYGLWAWSKVKTGQSNLRLNSEALEENAIKNSTKDQTGEKELSGTPLEINSWNMSQHIIAIAGVIGLSLVSGLYLQHNTSAAWPYLDSFTTWASVLTTYMVARKVLENWVYWIVIDFVAMLLYVDRGLYPTAMLFFIYLIMCVFGFIAWRKNYEQQRGACVESTAVM